MSDIQPDAAAPAPAAAAAVDPAAPAAAISTVASFDFPQLTGSVSFDCATIPAGVRLDFLKGAVRAYIANRLNAAHSRYAKDETVLAWEAYEAATKADPLQTTVTQPTVAKPAEPNYADVYARAAADLAAGTVRKQGDAPKARKTKDPLIALVTDVVQRAVYDSQRAVNPKYTFFQAKAEVGTDGIAYLNAQIALKVAAGADQSQLEAVRDAKYINPAKAMLGQTVDKKTAGLPSIL